MRLLIVDAYPREGRRSLREAGGTEAGTLYERMLRAVEPGVRSDVIHPADAGDTLPSGAALADYDGVTWTGSSLTIHAGDERVARQIALARACFAAGVPSFGSCWAAQVAAVAAGGACGPNPRGREFGVAREITLSPAGRAHPLFADKPVVFDAYTSHADHVTSLPRGATLLASNAWSEVQAFAVERSGASFWAVQYHPEYDAAEVAALCRLRAQELVDQGRFRDLAEAGRYAADLDAQRGEVLVDPAQRTLEVRNWLRAARGALRAARPPRRAES